MMPAVAEREETETCTVVERGRPAKQTPLPATVTQALTATGTKATGREIRVNGTPMTDHSQPVPRGAMVTVYAELEGG